MKAIIGCEVETRRRDRLTPRLEALMMATAPPSFGFMEGAAPSDPYLPSPSMPEAMPSPRRDGEVEARAVPQLLAFAAKGTHGRPRDREHIAPGKVHIAHAR